MDDTDFARIAFLGYQRKCDSVKIFLYGHLLKDMILGLMFREFIRSPLINRVYELILTRKNVQRGFIIYMCMSALNRLYTAGHFSVSEHSRECIEELYRAADSIKAFLDANICVAEGKRINRSEMYKAYDEYCNENDRQAHGKAAFSG